MLRVLVVERDQGLRESFEAVLEEAGCVAAGTGDPQLAEVALRVAGQPMIVLLGQTGPFEVASALLRRLDTLPPHAYLLLSTQPAEAPMVWNRHTMGFIPVLEIPCDLDDLLEAIDDAAARLTAPLPERAPVGAR